MMARDGAVGSADVDLDGGDELWGDRDQPRAMARRQLIMRNTRVRIKLFMAYKKQAFVNGTMEQSIVNLH